MEKWSLQLPTAGGRIYNGVKKNNEPWSPLSKLIVMVGPRKYKTELHYIVNHNNLWKLEL